MTEANSWLNAFITLVVILDPLGLIPVFLVLTIGMNSSQRRRTALMASLISFCVLIIFAVAGMQILSTLGISLGAFRMAGGILLFYIAFEMIFEKQAELKEKTIKVTITRDHIHNIAAFPLAMPLIAGPGTISATILMDSKHNSLSNTMITMLVLAVAIFICYFFMLLASPIERLIGSTGRSIVTRLFGLLLAAVAIQFVADGVRTLLWHA